MRLRAPPVPANDEIVRVAAFVNVPLVTLSVAVLPEPLIEVSSIAPLLVKLLATVRVAAPTLPSACTRMMEFSLVVNAPLIVLAPPSALTISNP